MDFLAYFRTKRSGISIMAAATVLLSLASCGTPNQIVYFQDMGGDGATIQMANPEEIRLRPKDQISILVNSRDPQLTDLFNLPIVSRQLGLSQRSGSTYGTNRGLSGYTLDENGNIDFPVLGEIHLEGMTREEVARYIKTQLVENNLVKDPVVTVDFMNLTISVLGEVKNPGRYNIDKDNITIMDALSMAGDLTIYGRRDSVLVTRQEDSKQLSYWVNLCSAESMYSSPAFYLQQGDMIYVEPNDVRARQSTVNGNNVRSTSFWISLSSLVTSICVLLFK